MHMIRCWLLIIDYQEWNKVYVGMAEQIIKQNVGIQKPFFKWNKLFHFKLVSC